MGTHWRECTRRVGAEGADAENRGQDLAIERRHLLACVEAGRAELRFANLAEAAESAWGAPGEDDVVALLDIGNAFADFLDDATAFVTEQEGEVVGAEDAVLGGQIGMTHATGENADQGFTWAGMGNEKFFDFTGCSRSAGDNAFGADWISHDALSFRSRRCRYGARDESPFDGGHRDREPIRLSSGSSSMGVRQGFIHAHPGRLLQQDRDILRYDLAGCLSR